MTVGTHFRIRSWVFANVQGMPHEGVALIVSPWPQCGRPKDLKALQDFDNFQALV